MYFHDVIFSMNLFGIFLGKCCLSTYLIGNFYSKDLYLVSCFIWSSNNESEGRQNYTFFICTHHISVFSKTYDPHIKHKLWKSQLLRFRFSYTNIWSHFYFNNNNTYERYFLNWLDLRFFDIPEIVRGIRNIKKEAQL